MNVVVVGGGASGLAAAIAALRKGQKVKILELKSAVGKKLLVTGNGRCNLTNLNLTAGCYNETALVKEIINEKTPQVLLEFFESVGIKCTTDSEGRVYPCTFSSSTVLRCLTNEVDRLGGEIVTNCRVEKIDAKIDGVKIFSSIGVFAAGSVIICSGGLAGVKDDSSYPLIDERYRVPVRAALAPVKTIQTFKPVDGLRVKCVAELINNSTILASERGEVLFRSYGLSGIAVFNLSSVMQRAIHTNPVNASGCQIKLDFFPDTTIEELTRELKARTEKWNDRSDNVFCGLLDEKLAKIVCGNLKAESPFETAKKLKNFTVQALPPEDFSSAQITCGGVDTKYINAKMRFLPLPNVYVCGELVDVDGLCGGYNLHWAFASGLVAGGSL